MRSMLTVGMGLAVGCRDPLLVVVVPPAEIPVTKEPVEHCFSVVGNDRLQAIRLANAQLTVPATAVRRGATLTLCARRPTDPAALGFVWRLEVEPEEALLGPVGLVVTVEEPEFPAEVDPMLLVPSAEGPRPAFPAGQPPEGTVAGRLYRPGEAFVVPRDRFVTRANRPTPQDVLFVLDHTAGNYDEQVELGLAYPAAFHDDLVSRDIDFRVMVTSTERNDDAPFLGALIERGGVRWIDVNGPTTPFSGMVEVAVPPAPNGPTPGFEAATETFARDDNQAAFRAGARRTIVFVSDEPQVPSKPTIEAFVTDTVGEGTVHAFTAKPGNPFSETALWTNGLRISTLGDNAIALGLADVAATLRRGPLTHVLVPSKADPSTLQAWLVPDDGEPWKLDSTDFTYDATEGVAFAEPPVAHGGDLLVVWRERPR